ncbi:thiamine-binding protein [Saccharopolyspora rectivirgula]|jgi:uncharacterized protein YqgV (UPF0045/DUF77 family)|uniref:Thiamine-binding protein domain-containing protein n=1 Tax=Saccharopolyspora rectivirgula TaxID=28042 RepID=A0A073BBP4_9PSEU|nr:thiamine-binding protein [Saccharopolyspora rectivirgula]KEI45149.1 hypothetical protein GU90_05000 [Saccharopolyspora rectivirgula]
MMLRAEFTTEPFRGEGDPPEHAVAARDCLRTAGLEPDFGPFGTTLEADREELLPALAQMLDAALSAGATRITLQISATPSPEERA